MIDPLLEFLKDGHWHSGEELALQLNLTRAAVWKQIRKLQEKGLQVEATTRKGYRIPGGFEALDDTRIRAHLLSEGLNEAKIAPIHVFQSLESTNDVLLEKLKNSSDLKPGTLVVSEMQTQGRGRMGRTWVSPFGHHIYASFYWKFDAPIRMLPAFSLVVGIALIRVLKRLNVNSVQLKWPNDLVWQGKKLGGVLIETRSEAEGPLHAIVGIGLNIRGVEGIHDQVDQPSVDLETIAGRLLSRNELLAHLIVELHEILPLFEQQGFSYFRSEWQTYDCLSGKKVELEAADGVMVGQIESVDEEGSLCIRVKDQLKKLHSSFRNVRVLQKASVEDI